MLLIVLLALVVTSTPVSEKLKRAHAYADSLDLQEARDLLLEVIADPRASESELMDAHLLAGQLERILERDVDARMHFRWVLSRDKDAQLPADAAPKIRTFFELVRDELYSTPQDPAPVVTHAQPESPPPDPQNGFPVAFVIAGGAGMVALGAVAIALYGESIFAQESVAFSERQGGRDVALAGWGLFAVATTTSAVAIAMGLVE